MVNHMKTENSIAQKRELINTIILSFLFPGMGFVYNGYKWTYGTGIFLGVFLLYTSGIIFGFTGIIFGFIGHIIGIYECYNIRKKMNNRELPDKKGTKVQYILYFISIIMVPFLYVLLMIFLYSLITPK